MPAHPELSVWIKCHRRLGKPALRSDEWDLDDPRCRSHAVRYSAVTVCGVSIPHDPGSVGWVRDMCVRAVDASTVNCRRCRRGLGVDRWG